MGQEKLSKKLNASENGEIRFNKQLLLQVTTEAGRTRHDIVDTNLQKAIQYWERDTAKEDTEPDTVLGTRHSTGK